MGVKMTRNDSMRVRVIFDDSLSFKLVSTPAYSAMTKWAFLLLISFRTHFFIHEKN